MKKTKKLATLFLAVVMVLSMSTTVFAGQTATVASSDTAKATTTTGAAISTTGSAVKTTTGSAVTTTAPAVTTTAPAVKTTAPAVTTTAPAVKTTAPAVTTTAPAVKTTAPAVTTTAPAVKTTAPAVKTTAPAVTLQKETATATTATVLVNNKKVAFEAYNIGGNNYFKLRDLAQAVNGSAKQFAVNFDQSKNAISLVSNTAYTAAGGELVAGDGTAKAANPTTSTIYKDNAVVALTAYNINNNNYFKLRDVAKAFNIGITYDNTTKTVGIDTTITYTEETTTTTPVTNTTVTK